MERESKKDKLLDLFFKVGVIIKGIDGFFEIIGGFIFIFVSSQSINRIILWLTQHELTEDPGDLIANWSVQWAQGLSVNAKIFGAIYLFTHGIIKIVLVLSLLRQKLWAYPTAIIIFFVFILYQIYRYFYSPSLGLIALTVLDAIVIILTWREYRKLKLAGV